MSLNMASWGPLEAILTPLGGLLEASWGPLGASCELLGPKSPPRAPKSPPRPPKSPPRPKKATMGHRLGGGVWEGVLGPCWLQEPSKCHSKCIQNFSSFLISIFHRFFIDFEEVLGRFWAPCWLPRGIENWVSNLIRFLIDFLSIFTDFGRPETLFLTNSPREIPFFQNLLSSWFFKF